jgi:hypothetical protein
MQLKKISFTVFILLIFFKSYSQQDADTINEKNVKSTLTFLASDKLKGRVNYSKEQLVAAMYIGDKFREYGLSPFTGFQDYYQPFAPGAGKKAPIKDNLEWNGKKLESHSYVNLTRSLITVKRVLKDYKLIRAGDHLPDSVLIQYWHHTANVLIWLKKTFKKGDTLIPVNTIIPSGAPQNDILIVASPRAPVNIKLTANRSFVNKVLYNVIGVLPGKSKPDEAIIFSAHYDHIDSDPEGQGRGSIFNGANDNASGTAAVLALARYFSLRNDNARTIIFCLFAGEEIGLLGSQAFVQNISAENIKATVNIEMIGNTNRTGKNGFFITGSKYSDLEKILEKNLKGEKIKIIAEGKDPAKLFERSDNYSFFQKGIPAHSIMCSDDSDPCYHQPCDDADQIDFENMTGIIKAIAKSCRTLISGEDTPVRVKGEN